jgi:hypothetical protein
MLYCGAGMNKHHGWMTSRITAMIMMFPGIGWFRIGHAGSSGGKEERDSTVRTGLI